MMKKDTNSDLAKKVESSGTTDHSGCENSRNQGSDKYLETILLCIY